MTRHRRDATVGVGADDSDEAASTTRSTTVLDKPRRQRSGARPTTAEPASPELPAWPVLALLWGVPVWWLLGLFPFSCAVMTPIMLFYLVLRRPLLLARGTLAYLALVAWMVTGVLVIEPGDEFGFLVKFIQWASVAVLIVYVVNARAQLTRDRILAGLTAMWVVVIAGGYLGMLLPNGRLTTTVGSLLPLGIRTNAYAQQLLFPQFAEIQRPFGADPFLRPSAPFYFANGWGAAMTVLIPVAVAYALHRGTPKVWFFTLLGLALTVPPAVTANNRGMFLALGVTMLVLVLRMIRQGRLGSVFAIVVVAAGAVLAMLRLGLLESLVERETAGRSSEGRGQLYLETFQRTLKSPVLGYGSPRASFTSEITVGTQGAVWAALFCTGFVGLALLLYFLLGTVVRTWHLRSPSDMWLNGALLATCAMSVYYGLEGILVPLGVLSAMMLRDNYQENTRRTRGG